MKHSLFRILIALITGLCGTLAAQNRKSDSLEHLLRIATADTTRARLMHELGFEYKFSDPQKAKTLAQNSYDLAVKTGARISEAGALNLLGIMSYLERDILKAMDYYKRSIAINKELANYKGLGSSYSNMANILLEQAAFDSAIYYQQLSIQNRVKLADKKALADSYTNLGNIYNMKGEYSIALELFFKALESYAGNNEYGMGTCYYNIGRTFFLQGKHKEAIEYSEKSKELRLRLNDKAATATNFILEASAYQKLKDFTQARKAIDQSIELQKEINDAYGLMYSYQTLGSILFELREFDKALGYFELSRKAAAESNTPQVLIVADFSIGSIYMEQGNFKKALAFQEEALKNARKYNAMEEVKTSLLAISNTYRAMKDPAHTLLYLDQHIKVKDSLMNETTTRQLNEFQAKYESEKKQKEIELLKKTQEIDAERMARQNIITYSVAAGLVLLIVLAFILYRRNVEKQKANVEITTQKDIIEQKQKEILDSIHYAKRIQQSLFPTETYIARSLKRLKN